MGCCSDMILVDPLNTTKSCLERTKVVTNATCLATRTDSSDGLD